MLAIFFDLGDLIYYLQSFDFLIFFIFLSFLFSRARLAPTYAFSGWFCHGKLIGCEHGLGAITDSEFTHDSRDVSLDGGL